MQQNGVLSHLRVRHLHPHRSRGFDGQVRNPCRRSVSLILLLRMKLQVIRCGDEKHLHRDWVWDYHHFSAHAWDIYDLPRRKGRR